MSAEVERVGDTQQPEPRRHHFVPACWLAGFTESGDKDGELWVTDFSRGRQWQTNPEKAGVIKDFYRIDEPNPDPVIIEKALSKIEDEIAPVFKALDRERREPFKDELDALLHFMAIQWVRIPAFRPFALGVLKSINREILHRGLKNRESWAAMLGEAGIAADTPGVEYERVCEAERSGKFELSAGTAWYMQQAFNGVDQILPSLRKRHWSAAFSETGSFIACDGPVIMEGPKEQWIGFGNADFISYAVSRHVTLYGTLGDVGPPFANRKHIAGINTLAMLRADQQVFSHRADFCFLDEMRKHQTDWKLYSYEKFKTVAAGGSAPKQSS